MGTNSSFIIVLIYSFILKIKDLLLFLSLSGTSNNLTPSVNGFLNKIEFLNGNHGALVFHPGLSDELMFGLHTNGNFYWGTGRSATVPDYYSMILNGSNGDLEVKGTTLSKPLSINGANSTPSVNNFRNALEFTGGSHAAMVFHPGQPDELMFGLHTNGNFYWGIGRSATKPDYYPMFLDADLGIRGKLTANEVNVKVGGWADFVFSDDYELPDLNQIAQFIKQNHHLPDIPTEKEVIENGVDLGKMDSKLLQKVEELTLYLIAVNKRLERLENENKKLKASKSAHYE